MDWKDIANAVGKAAPILGTALGGPIGGLAGALVASALGTENTPDAVSTALSADPAALEKLKEAELANKAQMQQLLVQQEQNRMQFALNTYQAEASDRDSARKLAAQQPKDFMRPLLSIVVMAATVTIVMLVLLGVADGTLKDPVIAATAGGLVMYFVRESSQVLGFWFGMTQDSARTNAVVRDFAVSPGSVSPQPSMSKAAPQVAAQIINPPAAPAPQSDIYRGS